MDSDLTCDTIITASLAVSYLLAMGILFYAISLYQKRKDWLYKAYLFVCMLFIFGLALSVASCVVRSRFLYPTYLIVFYSVIAMYESLVIWRFKIFSSFLKIKNWILFFGIFILFSLLCVGIVGTAIDSFEITVAIGFTFNPIAFIIETITALLSLKVAKDSKKRNLRSSNEFKVFLRKKTFFIYVSLTGILLASVLFFVAIRILPGDGDLSVQMVVFNNVLLMVFAWSSILCYEQVLEIVTNKEYEKPVSTVMQSTEANQTV